MPKQPLDSYEALIQSGLTPDSKFAGLLTQGYLPSGVPTDTEFGLPGTLANQRPLYPALSTDLTVFSTTDNTSIQVPGYAANKLASLANASLANGSPALILNTPLPKPPSYVKHHGVYDGQDNDIYTYAGSDMRVMIEVADPSGVRKSRAREFLELTTLSVSIYRVKAPVRACGYINPKGFARGTRTIAGTMVMTQFTVDVLFRFLWDNTNYALDQSEDSRLKKPDQLPPFNLTLLFGDEYGNQSCRRLFGVDMANDGTVYSTQDMYTEQTISYMASDFTPLLPIEHSAMLDPKDSGIAKTPMSQLVKQNTQTFSGLGSKTSTGTFLSDGSLFNA